MITFPNGCGQRKENIHIAALKNVLGEEWKVTSAGGATGEAYYASYREKQLFIKRNSSPFLAVLSVEGIVPKLLWTKRLENGDVITAQQWVQGRALRASEMNHPRISKLLGRIHHSKELLEMLKRLGKDPLLPSMILEILQKVKKERKWTNVMIERAFSYLERYVSTIYTDELVVCHCDVNHNNWIYGDDDSLYLIDWDGAMVADPALDLGLLLYWYIEEDKWDEWLMEYGCTLTEDLKKRMLWYVIAESIYMIYWHKNRGEEEEKQKWYDNLLEWLPKNEQEQLSST